MKSVRSSENLLALNFGSRDCKNGVAKLQKLIETVDIMFLNRFELAHLLNKKADKLDLKKDMYKLLKCKLPILVVTDSAKGSHAYTAEGQFFQPVEKVSKVVDCTGAGDAFTTAFLAKYAETKDIQKSLEFGSKYAAKILGKIGAN